MRKEHFKMCIEKARDMANLYHQEEREGYHHVTIRSVDALLDLCRARLGKNIEVSELPIIGTGKTVKGMFMGLDSGGYEIYLFAGMDLAYRRFILCKELFHVVLDDEESWSIDLYGHLEEVTSTIPLPESDPNRAAAWEELAEIAAMEFLFPYRERRHIFTDGCDVTVFQTAAATYQIPQIYIESFCGEAHMAYFKQFEVD